MLPVGAMAWKRRTTLVAVVPITVLALRSTQAAVPVLKSPKLRRVVPPAVSMRKFAVSVPARPRWAQ